MGTQIGTRMILGVGVVTLVVIGTMSILVVQAHTTQLIFERTRSANQLSETIKSSTHYDMLENRRENLHRQIRMLGGLQQEGIRKVRLFNKEGQIMFSSVKEEIGTVLNKQAEACYACHAEGLPLEKLDIHARARIFRGEDGSRVLGIINSIPNEPSCWAAACHAHTPEQRILGVLDVNVSLAEADREIAHSRLLMAGLASLAIVLSSLILWWLNRTLVLRPVAALVAGTRRVAEGDLTTSIPVTAQHELGELAKAFNHMMRGLADSQRQLAQADKLASVGRLAAGVAHEINNPLTGVLSYASLLAKRFASDPSAREDLDVIVRETKRCREIIRDLLDFARPAPPHRKPTDLNGVVHRALAVLANQLNRDNLQVTLELAANLPPAFADANQIQQVIVNLLLNAADAVGDRQGKITVTTRAVSPPPCEQIPIDPAHSPDRQDRPEPSVPLGEPPPFARTLLELTVEDNGQGIAPEDLPRLFEPFFTTKGPRGMGLGLAVTWGIITSHNGTIDVQSEPGRSTRLVVRIPPAGAQDAPAPISATPTVKEQTP